jgi:hypothetical protein
MHLVIHFNPGATWLFLCTLSLSLPFNILTDMPVANNSTGHCHDHIIWLLQMASTAKKVNYAGVTFQF